MHKIKNMPHEKIGLLLLRFGLAAVYIYFGFSQLLDAERWFRVVPDWATSLSGLSVSTIVMLNGYFDLIFGALLALGLWLVPVSFILAAHLAVITLSIGFNPTGVRDFGLTMATLAHGFLEMKKRENS
jgi:uncharacterized membrane protein YphA (DoxX/SURF4 family)